MPWEYGVLFLVAFILSCGLLGAFLATEPGELLQRRILNPAVLVLLVVLGFVAFVQALSPDF